MLESRRFALCLPSDRRFLEGFAMAARTINAMKTRGTAFAHHGTLSALALAPGNLRNAPRFNRGFVAGLRAAVGFAS